MLCFDNQVDQRSPTHKGKNFGLMSWKLGLVDDGRIDLYKHFWLHSYL